MHKLNLQAILTPSVFTVAPDTPLVDVLSSMESLRISCIVAVDEQQYPVGIFTEQDAIRLMAERKVVQDLRMCDVMSAPPLTARADVDFRDGYRLIADKGFRHLIVVDDMGRLIGILSEADFLHHMGMEYLVELKSVGTAMTRNLITLTEDATLADAVDLMAQHKISCIIITRDQTPVGILTERDTVSLARTISNPAQVHITRVMNTPLLTIDAQLPLQQAMKQMEASHIRRLVVFEGNVLAGIVTRHDIVKMMQGRYIEFLHETLERQRKDLHQAQKKIEQSRQQMLYHSLMEQVNDVVIVSQEASGIIIDCNEQACRSLEYTREELLRMKIFDITDTIAAGETWESERAQFARDGYRLVETEFIRHDRSRYPVEISARLLQKNNDHYIVAVARDLTERKRAEALQQLQDTALKSTANAIVITNKDGFIEWANPAFSVMTGFALTEALGKRPKELVNSGMQSREFYEVLWNTILSGNVWRGEVINKRKDGSHYTEEMTITPVHSEDKVITHFIAVKQDISSRKEAEFKLAQSEKTYRGILDSMTEAVYILNKQGEFIDVNHGAEAMYGYTRSELIGKTPAFVSAPDRNDLSAVNTALQLAYSGVKQHFEFWGLGKDGRIFPKDIILTAGDYFGLQVVIAVARDVTKQKLAEEKIELRESYLTAIIENQPGVVWLKNRDGKYLMVNHEFARTQGKQSPECLLGMDDAEIFGNGKLSEQLRADDEKVMRSGKGLIVEELLHIGNRDVWHETYKYPAFNTHGEVIGTTGITRDITARHEAEEQLREAAAVMQSTHEGVMVTDTTPSILATNSAFTTITGYQNTEALGKNPSLLNSGMHSKKFFADLWQSLSLKGSWQGEIWNRRKNGEIYPQLLTISTIYDEQNKPVRYIGVFADITQLKENQAQLEFMAHHDPLTKLPNRALAETRLAQELEQAHRHQQKLSVLFIDLDRFKQVNDSFGHLVGDELLCAVAQRLKERLREGDTLGRLGGDEFILVASPLQDKQDAAIIARDLINALSESFNLSNGVEVFIGGSIGISLFPGDGVTVADLTKNADAAMYLAKENGRNQFSFYTSELNADARNKLEMENDLRRVVLHNGLLVHFQPKVDIRTGAICGAEVLARWHNPDGTWVSPSQFIPLAEKSGVILTIGNWVLETTCAQIRAWLDAGLPSVCIAVNISSRQFHSGHLDKLVNAALDKYNVPAHCLELELTESMLMHEPDRAIATMHKLKKVGVKLSLDDFGTGYSNFGYLRRFPIDSLKIDQSFVQGITTRAEDAMIVDTIIGLAQRMKLRVIGEGVETSEQLSYLSTRGCDELQGFLFSQALPAAEFAALLRSGKGLSTR